LLADTGFRRFYLGYVTSLLGSAMAEIALTFAVLDCGGTAADLGYVFAASVVPQVIFMITGGVAADRLGRRRVMLVTDTARLVVQAVLAVVLFATVPPVWVFIVLSALLATGQGFFAPALGGLAPDLVPRARLADANALTGVARAATRVAGPALAGTLIAATSPATVIAVDAASFGFSVACLALLRIPPARPVAQSPWRDLADGWRQFRSRPWLWLTTAWFALFNLFTWAPFLLLGPVLARDYLGGARAWGTVLAALALGSVVTGLLLLGRRPARPLVVGFAGSYGYGVPCLLLALHQPAPVVAAGALLAGVGSAVFSACWATVMQQQVPPELLARTTAFDLTGSYLLGSIGYAVIGPLAQVVGPGRLLGFAAAYAAASSTVALALPAVRAVRWQQRRPASD
jgi:MFS family permease